MKTNWKKLIEDAFKETGETWGDVISSTLSAQELTVSFDAGTYFVNAEWSAVKTGATFFVGDILLWEISDGAQTLTDRPLVSCSVYQNQYGSDPYAVAGTITGTIILTSATLICWRVSASLPSGGYGSVSVTISNPTYIKKA